MGLGVINTGDSQVSTLAARVGTYSLQPPNKPVSLRDAGFATLEVALG